MWGGSRLKTEFGIKSDSETVAEAWMLSCNPEGASTIINGANEGKTLTEALFSTADQIGGSARPISTFFSASDQIHRRKGKPVRSGSSE